MKEHPPVIVVGAGVMGLSCGILLQEAGFDVTIYTRELPRKTTSCIAPALFYPLFVQPRDRVLRWGKISAASYLAMCAESDAVEDCGVSKIEMVEYFEQPLGTDELPWWAGLMQHVRRVGRHELPVGFHDGFRFGSFLIETPLYIPFLERRFRRDGGGIVVRELASWRELTGQHSIIVNCTGLGAREFADDAAVFPIRGQLLKIDASHEVAATIVHYEGRDDFGYVAPRRDGYVLGGTATEEATSLEWSTAEQKQILQNCHQIAGLPLAPEITERWVGFRPGRRKCLADGTLGSEQEVRLESETREGATIVHNYGHGGSGITLSWGCAHDVLRLVRDAVRRMPS